jgi:hypothetical protein
MEHSGGAGGASNGSMKGDAGPAMKGSDNGPSRESGSSATKGDRSSAAEDRSEGSKKNAASEDRSGKADRRESAEDHRGDKDRNRQAVDSDRNANRGDRADKSDRSDKMGDQAKDRSHVEKGATGASEGTEGKARPKGSLTNVSPEQKTRVRAAFSGHRVAPARDIGVSVNIGVVVPRSVHFYPLPDDIVTIVPDYRGYEYFMIDESHVAIVDPDTLEVVDIIVVA